MNLFVKEIMHAIQLNGGNLATNSTVNSLRLSGTQVAGTFMVLAPIGGYFDDLKEESVQLFQMTNQKLIHLKPITNIMMCIKDLKWKASE